MVPPRIAVLPRTSAGAASALSLRSAGGSPNAQLLCRRPRGSPFRVESELPGHYWTKVQYTLPVPSSTFPCCRTDGTNQSPCHGPRALRPGLTARRRGPMQTPANEFTPQPDVALLSNGRYGVLITAAGAGVSTWRDLDVTRWREDATRDCWGQFCYVADREGPVWSTGHQPLCRAADAADVAFHADRAEFRRRDGDVETRWAVCV